MPQVSGTLVGGPYTEFQNSLSPNSSEQHNIHKTRWRSHLPTRLSILNCLLSPIQTSRWIIKCVGLYDSNYTVRERITSETYIRAWSKPGYWISDIGSTFTEFQPVIRNSLPTNWSKEKKYLRQWVSKKYPFPSVYKNCYQQLGKVSQQQERNFSYSSLKCIW
jgi:hypothetical protein